MIDVDGKKFDENDIRNMLWLIENPSVCENIGREIARELFELGSEYMQPCTRIEFRSKGSTCEREDEQPMGGLCETALANFLYKAIKERLDA